MRSLHAGHATRALITTRRNLRGVNTTSDVPGHAVSSLSNKRAKQEGSGRVAHELGLTQHYQRAVKGFPSTLCRRKFTEGAASLSGDGPLSRLCCAPQRGGVEHSPPRAACPEALLSSYTHMGSAGELCARPMAGHGAGTVSLCQKLCRTGNASAYRVRLGSTRSQLAKGTIVGALDMVGGKKPMAAHLLRMRV